MRDYRKLFLSKEQYLVDRSTDFKSKIPTIINIINSVCGLSVDWSYPDKTEKLTELELINIQKAVSGEAQESLVSIISPYIEPQLRKLFGKDLKYQIRVSAQVKSRWSKHVGDENRMGFFSDNIFYEHKTQPNIAFPTRAHQDLDNNGNRGSHTMIFYFQLTEAVPGSSALEFGKFDNDIGMLRFSSKWGYPNEIDHDTQEKIDWEKPDLTPGNIMLMTGLTPHRSSKVGQVPRVALNVKIQPSNICYLEHIYDACLESLRGENSLKTQLHLMKEILAELSKKHRLLLYELAVVEFLLGNKVLAKQTLKELCLFDIDDKLLDKWIVASILKKVMYHVTEDEINCSLNIHERIVPLSSGHAILETINLYS